MENKVCIIGAGFAGVSAVKSCLEEGLRPMCYEMRRDVGGTWNYNADEKQGRSRAYKFLITNSSKEASCFSDFPFPKEWPPYITCAQFHEYIKNYIAHFGLAEHIHLNTQVVSVTKHRPHSGEQGWKVTTRDLQTSEEDTKVFERVMVCSGRAAAPAKPRFKGLHDVFKGKVIHSCEYDCAQDFAGKRVLIIGLGNSAADIAAEVGLEASETFMSTRSGAWIVPRVFRQGLPVDMTIVTRFLQLIRDNIPACVAKWGARKLLRSGFDLRPLGIESRYGPWSPVASCLVNDDLPSRIISGRVKVRKDVSDFGEDRVTFSDGTAEKVDVVICGTGYNTRYPFLSDSVLPDDPAEMELFEWMIPFNLQEPSTLAVIGVFPYSGNGAIPVLECQTRYIAKVMSGKIKLPSVKDMQKAFEEDRVNYTSHGRPFLFKRKISLHYADRLAKMGGFYPGFWSLLFQDPKLAIAVHTGPFTAYHYRLVGQHTWAGARERTMNALENTLYGINLKRNCSTNKCVAKQ